MLSLPGSFPATGVKAVVEKVMLSGGCATGFCAVGANQRGAAFRRGRYIVPVAESCATRRRFDRRVSGLPLARKKLALLC